MPCQISAIIAKIDKKGTLIEASPQSISRGDSAIVELVPRDVIYVEKFSDFAPFGRILVR